MVTGIKRFNLATSLFNILNTNDENSTDFIIAKYFLDHLYELSNTSIYTVADQCYLSRSSIQRFIKNIGFDSFTSLKEASKDLIAHQRSYTDYTDHTDYNRYLSESIKNMMDDINSTVKPVTLTNLARRIHDADTVVLMTAEGSGDAVKNFQQQMLTMGKLIRVVTSSSLSSGLLDQMDRNDMVITCSVTGNYAIAIQGELSKCIPYKCLITLNHSSLFESVYSSIFYIGKKISITQSQQKQFRNAYTMYGMEYFLDLLFHYYFMAYRDEAR
ncbi:MAG: MurR/RpiR family transcriptional regulator [Oscillospiraceae bacterium]|nr:MurR/RpiR family transcriptional regulator [Oscillospiraceae bacterium]